MTPNVHSSGEDIKCEHCQEEHESVQPRSAMTSYHWNGTGDNPNADVVLCDLCWGDYRDYWQERWDDYYSGCL